MRKNIIKENKLSEANKKVIRAMKALSSSLVHSETGDDYIARCKVEIVQKLKANLEKNPSIGASIIDHEAYADDPSLSIVFISNGLHPNMKSLINQSDDANYLFAIKDKVDKLKESSNPFSDVNIVEFIESVYFDNLGITDYTKGIEDYFDEHYPLITDDWKNNSSIQRVANYNDNISAGKEPKSIIIGTLPQSITSDFLEKIKKSDSIFNQGSVGTARDLYMFEINSEIQIKKSDGSTEIKDTDSLVSYIEELSAELAPSTENPDTIALPDAVFKGPKYIDDYYFLSEGNKKKLWPLAGETNSVKLSISNLGDTPEDFYLTISPFMTPVLNIGYNEAFTGLPKKGDKTKNGFKPLPTHKESENIPGGIAFRSLSFGANTFEEIRMIFDSEDSIPDIAWKYTTHLKELVSGLSLIEIFDYAKWKTNRVVSSRADSNERLNKSDYTKLFKKHPTTSASIKEIYDITSMIVDRTPQADPSRGLLLKVKEILQSDSVYDAAKIINTNKSMFSRPSKEDGNTNKDILALAEFIIYTHETKEATNIDRPLSKIIANGSFKKVSFLKDKEGNNIPGSDNSYYSNATRVKMFYDMQTTTVQTRTVQEGLVRKIIREKLKKSKMFINEAAGTRSQIIDKINSFVGKDGKVNNKSQTDAQAYWQGLSGASDKDDVQTAFKSIYPAVKANIASDSEFVQEVVDYGKYKNDRDKRNANRQKFADAIIRNDAKPDSDNWFNDDYEVEKFYVWIRSNADEDQKKLLNKIKATRADGLSSDDKEILNQIFEGGEYNIGTSEKEEIINVTPAAKKYLQSNEARAVYNIDTNYGEKGERSSTGSGTETKEEVPRSKTAYKDANESQAELVYGKVGTFLRASIRINAQSYKTVEPDDLKESHEQKIRSAIRKILLKEQTEEQEEVYKSDTFNKRVKEFSKKFVEAAMEDMESKTANSTSSINKDKSVSDFEIIVKRIIVQRAQYSLDGLPDFLQEYVDSNNIETIGSFSKNEYFFDLVSESNTSFYNIINKLEEDITNEYTAIKNLSDNRLKSDILTAMSQEFEDSVWAVFCTFRQPNKPYYVVCIECPTMPDIVGVAFPKSANAGTTSVTNLGNYQQLSKLGGKNQSVTALRLYTQSLVLECIENAAKGDPNFSAEDSISARGLNTEFNASPAQIMPTVTYNDIGKLFEKRELNDSIFVDSLEVMNMIAKNNSLAQSALDLVVNAKGVISSSNKDIIKNFKSKNKAGYNALVTALNDALTGVVNAGTEIPISIIKPVIGGDSRSYRITSSVKIAKKALKDNDDELGSIQSALTQLFDSTNEGENLRKSSEYSSESKTIKLPLPLSKIYLNHTDLSKTRPDSFGIKPLVIGDTDGDGVSDEETQEGAPYNNVILPPLLSEIQYLTVASYYYAREFLGYDASTAEISIPENINNKQLRAIKREISKQFRKPRVHYTAYKSKYNAMIEYRKKELLRQKKKKEATSMVRELASIKSGNYSTGFKYFNVEPSTQNLIDTGKVKRKEKNISGTNLKRKNQLFYLHSPNVSSVNVYDKFIKKFIAACAPMSAAANISQEKVKLVYENIVNRHQVLYNIYIKNKIKENVKKRFLSSFDAKSKKKLRAALFEDYEPGTIAIGNYKDVFGRTVRKSSPNPKETSQAGKEQKDKKGFKTKKKPKTTTASKDPKAATPAAATPAVPPEIEIADGYDSFTAKGLPGGNEIDDYTADEASWPVDYSFPVTSFPSKRRQASDESTPDAHNGIDIAVPASANVMSVEDGKVILIQRKFDATSGYGGSIIIDHGRYLSSYAHLSAIKEGLTVGNDVKKGDVIGNPGNSGFSGGVHLHFEIRDRDNGRNPISTINYIFGNDSHVNNMKLLEKDKKYLERDKKLLSTWVEYLCPGDGPVTGGHTSIDTNYPSYQFDPVTGDYDNSLTQTEAAFNKGEKIKGTDDKISSLSIDTSMILATEKKLTLTLALVDENGVEKEFTEIVEATREGDASNILFKVLMKGTPPTTDGIQIVYAPAGMGDDDVKISEVGSYYLEDKNEGYLIAIPVTGYGTEYNGVKVSTSIEIKPDDKSKIEIVAMYNSP